MLLIGVLITLSTLVAILTGRLRGDLNVPCPDSRAMRGAAPLALVRVSR